MKIKKTVSLSVLFVSVLLRVTLCHGQSNVVYYGVNSNAISLAFADVNLSASAKEAITADLRVCLSEWGKKSELYMRNKGESIGYLYNFKSSPHYPENITFPREIVPNGVSGLALYIPKKLSDAYTNAFAFAAANSNIVAAAYEFVAFVSSTNFPGISSNALPNYIMFKNALPDANAESNAIINLAPQIIPDLCDQTYYPPSILGFTYSSDGPAATNLWMQVPESSPSSGGGKDWGKTTVLWHENKWRFCVWLDWVP
jgi:hypothetical protein